MLNRPWCETICGRPFLSFGLTMMILLLFFCGSQYKEVMHIFALYEKADTPMLAHKTEVKKDNHQHYINKSLTLLKEKPPRSTNKNKNARAILTHLRDLSMSTITSDWSRFAAEKLWVYL